MKPILRLGLAFAIAGLALTVVSTPALAQEPERVKAQAKARPGAVAQLTLKRGLLAKPANTEGEAWLLLRQMRAASVELQTVVEQGARGVRMSRADRANHSRGLEHVRAMQAELDAAIEKWEQKLSSIGDDAQLANIDLQNMLQKQQQTLQTMSNVSKMLHDTAMAIIRKIG